MPALVPLGAHTGKPPIPLKRPVLLVGSRNIAHLHLMSSKVSKAHALIINSDGKIYIRDLASRTHVYVNNKQVREADLQHGDQLRIGSFVFRVVIPQSWRTPPRETKLQPAQLEVDGAEMPVRLDERVTLIGRRPTSDISLIEDSASTAHAVIFDMGGKRFIRDLGSRTGTFVNGRSIHQEELKFGDLIKIGETEFRFTPAPAIPVGPVPVDAEIAQSDLDELEDLVGTAPLLEEPPEVVAKRLEQEAEELQQRRTRPAAPTPPAVDEVEDSGSPIPLDVDIQEPAAEPAEVEPEPAAEAEEAEQDLPVEPVARSASDLEPLPLEDDGLAPLDLEGEAPAQEAAEVADEAEAEEPAPAEASVEDDAIDLSPPTAPAVAEPTDQVPAGIDELDLSLDSELEAGPIDLDPEATRALPPEFKPKKKTPAISEQIVEDTPPELPVGEEAAVEPADDVLAGVQINDSASDTVTLPDGAVLDEPEEEAASEQPEVSARGGAVDQPETPAAEAEDATEAPAADAPKSRKRASRKKKTDEGEAAAKPKRSRRRKKDAIAPVAEAQAAEQPAAPESAAAEERSADDLPAIDEPLALAGDTLESTEPTPESAQALDNLELDDVPESPVAEEPLTDSGFDREVRSFVVESPEPIVESAADEQPAEEQPSEAPAAEVLPIAEPADLDVAGETSHTPFDLAIEDDDRPAGQPALEIGPAEQASDETELPAIAEESADAEPAVAREAAAGQDVQWKPPAEEFAELDLDLDQESADTAATTAARSEAAELDLEEPEPIPAASNDDSGLVVEPEPDVARGIDAEVEPAEEDEDAAPATGIVTAPDVDQSPALDAKLEADVLAESPAVTGDQSHTLDVEGASIADSAAAVGDGDAVVSDEPATLAETSARATQSSQDQDEPAEDFETGVNQWGFLGGTPLNLHDAPPMPAQGAGAPTPPPARPRHSATPPPARGVPFARKSFVDDEGIDVEPSIPPAEFAELDEAAPQINEVDVFSQLGAPPEDDPFFGKAAQFGLVGEPTAPNAPAAPGVPATPHIPPMQKPAGSNESDKPQATANEWDHDSHEGDPHGAEATEAEAGEGFDDLIFADGGQAGSAEGADDSASGVEAEGSQPAPRDKAGVSPTPPPARNGTARTTPVLFGDHPPHPKRRKRWFFTVPTLFVLMLVSMVAAGGAIMWKVPVYGQVEGRIQFANVAGKSGAQRSEFVLIQSELLADSDSKELSLRTVAQAKLKEHYGDVSPGFLADTIRYPLLVEAWRKDWDGAADGVLRMRMDSQETGNDVKRMHALLLALYERNKRLLDQRDNAQHDLKRIEAEMARRSNEITRLQTQLEQITRHGAQTITDVELAALRTKVNELEAAWRTADERAKRVQSELERMREAAARAATAENPGDAKIAVEDATLKEMEQRAAELTRRLQAAKVADNMELDRTRQSMDQAIEALEQQIAQVQNQMKDVPEMKGYVFAAKVMQDTARSLVNELIHSQKQQLETINELKRKLDEQRVARQNEVWANDPDLKNLNALLDIQKRHYNAAMTATEHGRAREQISELESSIVRIEQQIEERRRVLGNDLLYAEAIKGMQDLIDQSQRRLAEDQKRADEQMMKMQAALAEQAPDLQKLPAEQKALAAELEKRLFEMNEARKAYAESLAKASTDGEMARRALEKDLLDLQTKMDARRQELIAERRKTMSEQEQQALLKQMQGKAAELTQLQALEKEAHEAFIKRKVELASIEKRLETAAELTEDRERVARELAAQRTEIEELAARHKAMQAAVDSAIYPIEPTKDNVVPTNHKDDRPFYALICISSIALLFGLAMLGAHNAAARDARAGALPAVAVQVDRVGSDPLDDIIPAREATTREMSPV